jgi:ABC-2 type transport system permease protein
MPQLGLLFIPVVIPMLLLSGGFTPLDSMPKAIQTIMMFSPSTHFVEFATAVLFRGAALAEVWKAILSMVAIGLAFFSLALVRFRKSIAVSGV